MIISRKTHRNEWAELVSPTNGQEILEWRKRLLDNLEKKCAQLPNNCVRLRERRSC